MFNQEYSDATLSSRLAQPTISSTWEFLSSLAFDSALWIGYLDIELGQWNETMVCWMHRVAAALILILRRFKISKTSFIPSLRNLSYRTLIRLQQFIRLTSTFDFELVAILASPKIWPQHINKHLSPALVGPLSLPDRHKHYKDLHLHIHKGNQIYISKKVPRDSKKKSIHLSHEMMTSYRLSKIIDSEPENRDGSELVRKYLKDIDRTRNERAKSTRERRANGFRNIRRCRRAVHAFS